MLSMTTNLNSLLVQKGLKEASNLLSEAVERMSTGLRINHAKDDVANFIIANNMTTQISSLDVADDNAGLGLDMLTIASDTLDLINLNITRLRDLAIQAENQTYSEESKKAINLECQGLVEEIKRLYKEAEFNGMKLFGAEFEETVPAAGTYAMRATPLTTSTYATLDTTLQQLGIDESSFEIYNHNQELIESYETEKIDTIGDIFNVLETYGFNCSITDGVISISSSNGRYVAGALMASFGIELDSTDFVSSTTQNSDAKLYYTATQTATEATTLGELGVLTSGNDTVVVKDRFGDVVGDIIVSSNTALGGLFNALGNYNIQGEVDDGIITLSSADGNYVVSSGVIANLGISIVEGSNVVTTGTTQTSADVVTYETVTVTGGEVITVQQEVTTTIWTTTTTSETVTNTIWITTTTSETYTNTVWITTTTGETLTETVWAVTTYETIYTTNTTETTLLTTIWTTTTTSSTQTETITVTGTQSTTKTGTLYVTTTVGTEPTVGFLTNPVTYTDAEVAAMTRLADVNSFSPGNTYSISTTEELVKFASIVNAGSTGENSTFVLGANIDLSSISNWTPIGNDYGIAFNGEFDGNGHVITNLNINSTYALNGLFGCIFDATIKNLGLEGGTVQARGETGALVGYVISEFNCKIENCYSDVEVQCSSDYVGGLIGYVDGGADIINCCTKSTVKGKNNIGGLIGYYDYHGIGFSIVNCYTLGDVIAEANSTYVGGFVGIVQALSSSYYVTISNCFTSGNVWGDWHVGGFAGQSEYVSISNSYTTGNISAINVSDGMANGVGGLVGVAISTKIENSYSAGTITGSQFANSIDNSSDWNGTQFTHSFVQTRPNVQLATITRDTTLEKLGFSIGENVSLVWSNENGNGTLAFTQITSTTSIGNIIDYFNSGNVGFPWGNLDDADNTISASLENGVLTFITAIGTSIDITQGFFTKLGSLTTTNTVQTANVTQTTTVYTTTTTSTTETETVWSTTTDIATQASTVYVTGTCTETSGTIWTTVTYSTTTTETIDVVRTVSQVVTETIWTTTTTSETLTETVWEVKTYETIYTTNVTEATIVTTLEPTTNPTYTDEEVAAMTNIQSVSTFTSGQTYKIETAEDLAYLATRVNAGASHTGAIFVLANDIDLSGYSNWTPIGTTSVFRGIFDGNCHVISNMSITSDSSGTNYVGLFAQTTGATIKNLTLIDANIDISSSSTIIASGLIGCAYGTTIENCYLSGNINLSVNLTKVGGLIGYTEGAIITNCATDVEILANDILSDNISGFTGGLVGHAVNTNISKSYSSGTIVSSQGYVGGLIGHVTTTGIFTITQCGSEVNVKNLGLSVYDGTGGLIGEFSGIGSSVYQYSEVSQCYSKGNVEGNVEDNYGVGGLIGRAFGVAVTNTYSTSNVVDRLGTSRSGLIGEVIATVQVSTSYAETSGWFPICGVVDTSSSYLTDLYNSMSQAINSGLFTNTTIWTSNTDSELYLSWEDDTSILANQEPMSVTITVLTTTTAMTTQSSTVYVTGTCSETSGTTWATNTSATTEVVTILLTTTETTTCANPSYTDEEVAAMIPIQSVTSFTAGQTYRIETAEDLAYLATRVNAVASHNGAIFVLANDIDLSGYSNWNSIGTYGIAFYGTFDGNGHVITNLTIDDTTKSCQGLFGVTYSNATIMNVGLENVNVNGDDKLGGLVGYSSHSTISNCYIIGNVNGDTGVGGLVGYSDSETKIDNCYVSATVMGSSSVGGFLGYANSNCTITNCYTSASVNGTFEVGGFVGGVYNRSLFRNCYMIGDVTGSSYAGGFVGNFNNSTINNCFTTANVPEDSNIGGFAGSNSSGNVTNCASTRSDTFATQMSLAQIQSTYTPASMGFTEANGWSIVGGNPVLSWQNAGSVEVVTTHIATATVTTTNVTSITKDVGVDEVLEETIYETTTTSSTATTTINITTTAEQTKTDVVYTTIVTSTTTEVNLDDVLTETVWTTTTTSETQTETVWATSTTSETQTETIWTTTTTSTTQTEIVDVTQTIDIEVTTVNISITSDTSFADLGLDSRAYVTIYNDATRYIVTIKTADTVGSFVTNLNSKGINTTLANGKVTIAPNTKLNYISGMSNSLVDALKLDADFYTTSLGVEMTDSNTYIYDGEIAINNSSELSQIGVTSGRLVVKKDGATVSTIAVSHTQNIGSFMRELENAGFRAYCMDGNIYLRADGDMYLENATTGSSNAITALKLTNIRQEFDSTYSNTDSDQLEKLTEIINKFWQAASEIVLQVGIYSDENSRITVQTGFTLDDIDRFANIGRKTVVEHDYITELDDLLLNVYTKQTELGAYMCRLESAIEEITIKYDGLLSSRSTILDVDMAEVSSSYIVNQILQQTSASLLSVVNQTPQLALQLL